MAAAPRKPKKGRKKANDTEISAPTGVFQHKVHVDQDFKWALGNGQSPETAFVLGDLLGEGAHGQVFKATHLETGFVLAIKIVKVGGINQNQKLLLQQEINILNQCRHPNIVNYYGCFHFDDSFWILMDYCSRGCVRTLIEAKMTESNNTSALREPQICEFLYSTLKGLVYLHQKGIIHRDVKAGNILLTESGGVKLADFGVSSRLRSKEGILLKYQTKTKLGSPLWMAPEVAASNAYNELADIWSLGITAIEMADGNPPHYEKLTVRALFLIANNDPPKLKDESLWSTEFVDFIAVCLKKDPSQRPTAEKLLTHPFMKTRILLKTTTREVRNSFHSNPELQKSGTVSRKSRLSLYPFGKDDHSGSHSSTGDPTTDNLSSNSGSHMPPAISPLFAPLLSPVRPSQSPTNPLIPPLIPPPSKKLTRSSSASEISSPRRGTIVHYKQIVEGNSPESHHPSHPSASAHALHPPHVNSNNNNNNNTNNNNNNTSRDNSTSNNTSIKNKSPDDASQICIELEKNCRFLKEKIVALSDELDQRLKMVASLESENSRLASLLSTTLSYLSMQQKRNQQLISDLQILLEKTTFDEATTTQLKYTIAQVQHSCTEMELYLSTIDKGKGKVDNGGGEESDYSLSALSPKSLKASSSGSSFGSPRHRSNSFTSSWRSKINRSFGRKAILDYDAVGGSSGGGVPNFPRFGEEDDGERDESLSQDEEGGAGGVMGASASNNSMISPSPPLSRKISPEDMLSWMLVKLQSNGEKIRTLEECKDVEVSIKRMIEGVNKRKEEIEAVKSGTAVIGVVQ